MRSPLLLLGCCLAVEAVVPFARVAVRRCHVQCMASDYVRGDDGGSPVDEKLVEELIEARTSLRRDRNFKAADKVRDDLQAMGVTLWDRDRVWMVGSEPPSGGRERYGRERGAPPARGGRDRRRPGGGGTGGTPDDFCRIFVEGLSYETTWQTLKDHFNDAGVCTPDQTKRAQKTRAISDRAL